VTVAVGYPYDVGKIEEDFDAVFQFRALCDDHISVGDQNVADYHHGDHPRQSVIRRNYHVVVGETHDFCDYQIHTDYQNDVLGMVVYVTTALRLATAHDLNYS
jgi:hypothetical protein